MRFLLCLVAVVAGGCAARSTLVGQQVPPYPDGLQERSGVCLPAGGGARDCQFSLSILDSDRGGKGQPTWRVVDSADVPEVKDGYSLEMQSCRRDGRKDAAIVAIVTPMAGKPESPWGNSYWAIRFDRKQKRFSKLPAGQVQCAGTDPNCL